ncbi:MAG: aldehyde dehydrogenase family protein [Planctomycetota bacterium]|nr:aldehyde dehydrogenase family protein [Planctomycetota bacterium]
MNHDSKSLASWPLPERLRWLRAFRRALATNQKALCDAMSADMGKPHFEGLVGELMPLLEACRWLERSAARLLRPRGVSGGTMLQAGTRLSLCREPLGDVAIIATWNYPIQLLGIQLIQALVAGNRVWVKPSERSPGSQTLLLKLAQSPEPGVQLPSGVLNVAPATREAGAELLSSRRFDHVVFTGSTSVGVQIARQLAPSLTPSTLELSGRDSALLLDDADANLAASVLWTAVVLNAGQTCMAPKRVLVLPNAYAAFVQALAPLAAGARPLTLVDEHAAETCFEQARQAMTQGGRSLSGVCEPPQPDASGKRRLLRPLVIVDCPSHAPLVAGNNFGPVLPVVPVRSLDEALAIHATHGQNLATSIFTRDVAKARELAPRLRSNFVAINDSFMPSAHPNMGLTGLGPSGMGTTRGELGLLSMTRPVYVARTRGPMRPTAFQPPDGVVRLLKRWMHWRHA